MATEEQIQQALDIFNETGSLTQASKETGIARSTLWSRVKKQSPEPTDTTQERITTTEDLEKGTLKLFVLSERITTAEQAIQKAGVDLSVYEVTKILIKSWEVGSKVETVDDDGKKVNLGTAVTPLFGIKVELRRKTAETKGIEVLLEELAEKSPSIPKLNYQVRTDSARRVAEISIVDPHMGMRCFVPGADKTWDSDKCEQMYLEVLERLILLLKPYGQFEEIVWPFGNDICHTDNYRHETTAGTLQPEADSWHEMFVRIEKLAIGVVERLKQEAPVKIVVIPGNHGRQSEFALGRLLNAYFHNDQNVSVDASSSPYKFYHFGVNLVGFDHGHSISPIRLAALLANECRNEWATTSFREWHLGDQHRKASAKPSTFEEQGVSVEYLPGLTPPNEWSRIKSFNWQKRAATGYVWDYSAGPLARLQVHIDTYTGEIMG